MVQLELGNLTDATRKLCSAAFEQGANTADDGNVVSSADILKAQRHFTHSFEELLALNKVENATVYADCLALLAYLTADSETEPRSKSQGNISAAMSTIASTSDEYQKRGCRTSSPHERVLQFGARLLYINASKGKPSWTG